MGMSFVLVRRGRRSPRVQPAIPVLASLLVGCADGIGPTEAGNSPAVAVITGRVAFASTRDGSPWIYVADSTGVRRLVPGDEPAWSPDASTIAFQSPAGISLIDADGTNARTIRSRGSQPSWSPDGLQIAFVDSGIHVMRADGSGDRLLVPDSFIQPGDELQRPDWSADGRRIAFVRYDCCWAEPVAIFAVGLDNDPPRMMVNGVVQNGATWYSHWSPAWSPDGRSMAFIHNFDLAVIGAADGKVTLLGNRAAWESDLDWSPDGGRLVFSAYNGQRDARSPFTGQLRLYVAVVATGEVKRLIPDAPAAANRDYWDNHAVWSHARR